MSELDPIDPFDPGPPLGPGARALLDAARPGLSPDAAAVRRMRARIDAAAGGATGAAIGVKLGLLGLAVVIAVGVGVAVQRRATVTEAPRVALASPSEAAVQVAVREAAIPAMSDEELIVLEPPDPGGPSGPSGPARRARPVVAPGAPRGARAPAVATAEAAPAVELAREVELLDLAMAALRRGAPAAALHAVQQHAAETAGRGQLAEDAAAIEIEALCHLHDATTGAKLEAFDARFPRSAQRSRLSSRCP